MNRHSVVIAGCLFLSSCRLCRIKQKEKINSRLSPLNNYYQICSYLVNVVQKTSFCAPPRFNVHRLTA